MSLYTINADLVKGAGDSGVYSPETPVGRRLRWAGDFGVSTGDSSRAVSNLILRARGGGEWFILPHPPPCPCSPTAAPPCHRSSPGASPSSGIRRATGKSTSWRCGIYPTDRFCAMDSGKLALHLLHLVLSRSMRCACFP
jgi:hypothetical protein